MAKVWLAGDAYAVSWPGLIYYEEVGSLLSRHTKQDPQPASSRDRVEGSESGKKHSRTILVIAPRVRLCRRRPVMKKAHFPNAAFP